MLRQRVILVFEHVVGMEKGPENPSVTVVVCSPIPEENARGCELALSNAAGARKMAKRVTRKDRRTLGVFEESQSRISVGNSMCG